ncbi:MAG: ribosome silencing factor [Alphaproteobacteria bacterium]
MATKSTKAVKKTVKKTVKTVAKKPSVRKAAPKPKAKATAAKKSKTVAKPVLKKTTVKKPVGKKTAVKKPVSKKPAVKKLANKKTAVKTAKLKAVKSNRPAGIPEQVRDIILRVLDERQAEQVVTIDLRDRSSMADYLVIGSGRAARQIAAIADLIRDELGKIGIRQVRSEGMTQGDWVLVDAGDVIVHLFRPEVRKFYNIEQIYGT